MLTFEVISQTVALSLVAQAERRTRVALLTDLAGHHVSLTLNKRSALDEKSDCCQCMISFVRLSKRIKNISLKRGSVFAFGMTENWATLVNGDKAEKQKECHLPDKLHCAAVIHKHKHHTATLSICPSLSWSHPQPHTHTYTHTHTHTHTQTQSGTCKQKLEMAFSRSWNTVHDTVSGLNWLCFSNCARFGDSYLLNNFRMSSPAALGRALHYPGEQTMTGHLRLDSVIAESLRHSEGERQSKKRGREMSSTGSSCSGSARQKMWFSSEEERQTHSKRGEMRIGGKSSLDVCLSTWDSGCICERVNWWEARGECKRNTVLHLWCDSSLKLIEKRQPVWLFFFSSSVLNARFPPLSMLLRTVWCSSPCLKWLQGGRGSDKKWQVTMRKALREGGWVNKVTSEWGENVILMRQQVWLHEKVDEVANVWDLILAHSTGYENYSSAVSMQH